MARRLNELRVHPYTFTDAIQTLGQWALGSTPRYVSTCTAYTLVRGLEDEQIFEALHKADMRTADGMPLVWLQRAQGHQNAERVYGPDVMLALLEKSTAHLQISHYFYGGLPGVPEKLAVSLQERIPNLKIAGVYSPPVSDVGTQPDDALVAKLNASGASVIWVGLGSPKQDLWMHLYRPALTAPLLIGVGAAFDFLSGTKSQAPRWMQRRGLEWLFRLYQEPGRLWKRYLVYNARFAAAVIMSLLRR